MEVMYLWCSGAICVLLAVINWINNRKSDLPPGPWNLPIVGYLPWLDPKNLHISLTKLSAKYGPIYGLYLGSVYTVVVTNIKLMKKIQMMDQATGRPDLFINRKVSPYKGIANTQGELWKNQRRFIVDFLKSVGASKLSHNSKQLEEVITQQALEFIQKVEDQGPSAILPPSQLLLHNMASIASKLLLGESYPRDDENWKSTIYGIQEVIKIMGIAGPLNFLPFLRVLPMYQAHLKLIEEVISNLIKKFNFYVDKRKKQPLDQTASLIEAFLEKQRKGEQPHIYTDIQLSYLLNDLFAAGMETTANTLSWFFLYLSVNQEVQAELRNELLEVLNGETPTMEHAPFLPHLEATIAEAARIRPVLPLSFPHSAVEDIKIGKLTIPKGTMIISSVWSVHMDPKEWDDPDSFRPERFLDTEGRFYKPEAFIPFHVGKRICAGEDLARMMMLLFGANIVSRFHIRCEDTNKVDLAGDCGLTLSPKPHRLIFTRIQSTSN